MKSNASIRKLMCLVLAVTMILPTLAACDGLDGILSTSDGETTAAQAESESTTTEVTTVSPTETEVTVSDTEKADTADSDETEADTVTEPSTEDSSETATTTDPDTESTTPEVETRKPHNTNFEEITTPEPDPNPTMHDLAENLDFGRLEITILSAHTDMQEDEFYLGENYISGARVISDAAYERDLAVEKQLNVNLVTIIKDKNEYLNSTHMTDVQGGLGEFQIIADRTTNKGIMVIDGFYRSLNDFEQINLNKDYWAQGFGGAATFGEDRDQYLATGAFAVSVYRMMYATFYNKEHLSTFGIEDPYTLVKSGEWTLDAQTAMINEAFSESNSEAVSELGDYYGFVTGENISMDPYLVSSDVRLIKRSVVNYEWAYDNYELNYLTKVVKKVQSLTTNDHTYVFDSTKDLPMSLDVFLKFANGDAMLATSMLYSYERCRGEIGFDMGIVPIPKYSTLQEQYYTYVSDMATSVGISSVVCRDEEKIGATLEALAYHGYKNVGDVYRELLLLDCGENAVEMLDLMYDTAATDFTGIMSSAIESFKMRDHFRLIFRGTSQETVVSLFGKNQTALRRSLKTINIKTSKLP